MHGAALIQAALAQRANLRFVGVAGPKMVSAGCEPIFDMSRHSAMLLGALSVAGRAIAMLSTSKRHLCRYAFDAAVVIDSPTLHLPLAAQAHAHGIPVLYYIAPQMWAWGTYRMHKLRNHVDKTAVILPFEEKFFRQHGVDATYVGHPLGDSDQEKPMDRDFVTRLRQGCQKYVTLLPGSRKHVVEANLPGQLETAGRIAEAFPEATFGVSVANAEVARAVESAIQTTSLSIQAYRGRHVELIEAADLVLVTSGTTTLEVAMHHRPMIVTYQSSKLFYNLIARWMLHTPWLSLPNILAGRQIVPEFMPYYTDTEPIAQKAIEILRDQTLREKMIGDLKEVTNPLRNTHASENTAEMLINMIDSSAH